MSKSSGLRQGFGFGIGAIIALGVAAFVIVGGFCAFCLLLTVFSDSGSDSIASRPTRTPLAPLTTDRVEQATDALLRFDEVLPAQGDMTDLQWQEYRKSLVGRRVQSWQGEVNEVREEALSDRVYVEVKISRQFDDVFLYIDKETALSLKKGQRITFSGEVTGTDLRLIRDGFALEVDNAMILSVE